MKRFASFIPYTYTFFSFSQLLRLSAMLLLSMMLPIDMVAAYSRHNTSIVSSITTNYEAPLHEIENLIDPTDDKYYFSGNIYYWNGQHVYLDVNLTEKLETGDTDDLVVYLKRPQWFGSSEVDEAQPVVFDVKGIYSEGSASVITESTLFKVYFQYRGPLTQEYSVRIPITEIFNNNPEYRNIAFAGLRFEPTKNYSDGKYAERTNGTRDVALNSFDVIKIARNEPYSDSFLDNFHLKTDYYQTLKDFEFVNTGGIADSRNHINGWDILTESEIDQLKKLGITYPDLSLITSSSDKKRNPYPLDSGQKRQPTHTIEHIVYAMPGDVIPLYPYYGLSHTTNFKDNFSHWYEFKSGGIPDYTAPWSGEKIELLDFLADPAILQKSANNGFYGGFYMNTGKSNYYEITSVDEYIEIVKKINTSNGVNILDIKADLDFAGRNDVPMINEDWHYHFFGIVNGNGHTISNLNITKDEDKVGLVKYTDAGAIIENLIIDSSCSFQGKKHIGLVGYHCGGNLTIRNVRTEAKCIGTENQAAAILGESNEDNISINIEDCYIGGIIKSPYNSAVIIGWWKKGGNFISNLKRVIINCEISGADNTNNRRYIRSDYNSEPMINYGNGVKGRGIFRFEECYAMISENTTLEPQDECWCNVYSSPQLSATELKNLTDAGWSDSSTPPQSSAISDFYSASNTSYAISRYPDPIMIGDEEDYINKISAFNEGKLVYDDKTITNASDKSFNAYFVLTQDLDFANYGPQDVPMIGQDYNYEFGGIFNGAGHTIKNLRIIRNQDNVGMFGRTRQGVRIENLTVDASCVFEGKNYVGLIGNHRWDPLVMKNVKTEAIIRGSRNSGGIVGLSSGYSTDGLQLENIYVGGVVGYSNKGLENGAISGWFDTGKINGTMVLKNVVINCNLYNYENSNGKKIIRHPNPNSWVKDGDSYVMQATSNLTFKFTDCFANIDPTEIAYRTYASEFNAADVPVLDGWEDQYTPLMADSDLKPDLQINDLFNKTGDRSTSSVATFYCPLNPFDTDVAQSLPLPAGKEEYVVAADFSQTFDPYKNIDIDSKQIIEPIIAFRHIFRVRDGKTFADNISGSEENNINYLRKTRKYVSVRNGASFQMRLDNPVPIPNGNKIPPSHYYYVNERGEYCQVAQMGIKVLDGDKRTETSQMKFKFDNIYPGYGYREIDGIKYALGEGSFLSEGLHPDYNSSNYNGKNESEYYLILTNDGAVKEGHYLVQIVAKDYNGKVINIKGTSKPLVLMEYDVKVLPTAGSIMLTGDELYTNEANKKYRPEELEIVYGNPTVKIDFDEYMQINRLTDTNLKNKLISKSTYYQESQIKSNPSSDSNDTPNGMQKTWFKWPVSWLQSTYSFGYDNRQDYSMYQLATHSENVVWKWAVKDFPENSNPTSMKGNNPGDGTGLYDRRYYASKLNASRGDDIKQGYFYYVNAASDPGVTASLRINEICQGSAVVVSAWMAEFSDRNERANLSFNFVAVLNDSISLKYPTSGFADGERVVLHKFLTGYVPAAGSWYNIYYEFTPRLAEFSSEGVTSDMVDHYELELDNNAKNSDGADYAIDDIRAYVVPPTVEADQLSPLCANEELRMKLASPFETLLEIAGKRECINDETNECDVYYTYLDKEKFDAIYDESKGNYKSAFDASVIEFDYNIPDEEDMKYGKITFNANYSKNPVYRAKDEQGYVSEPEFGKAYSDTKESGERMIAFESNIASGCIKGNKHYYVVFKSVVDNSDVPAPGEEAVFFNMLDSCANTCVTFIPPAMTIKVDGKIEQDVENITICENQSPVLQINLQGIHKETGQIIPIDKNVYFDWFYGTEAEYYAYNDGDEAHSLDDALTAFRLRYETAQSLDAIKADEKKVEGQVKIEQWMLDLIKKASTPDKDNPYPKLSLYLSSYVMPPAQMTEDGQPVTHTVVVVPIACVPINSYRGDTTYLVCSSVMPLSLTVNAKSPMIRHGLTDIAYPEKLIDVPLRIGMDQLLTNLTKASGQQSRIIDIPIRRALSSDKAERKLKVIKEKAHKLDKYNNSTEYEVEGAVILAQTNDPEYRDIGTIDKNKNEIETLLWVGDIKKLIATTDNDDVQKYIQVEFDSSFKFKEGYFYRFRYQFEESGMEENDDVCSGQDVFTIKVVPKYLAWTGGNGLNWNDDANWRRVASEDLEITNNVVGNRADAFAHYITNGNRGYGYVNANVSAYAPLDFTSVIVEYGAEAPFMYHPASERTDVKDEYDSSVTYTWPSDPEKGKTGLQDDDPGQDAVGKVTELINYDMAAFEFNGNRRDLAEIGCRPWYANTCKDIHFKPGATIMNQQYLTYRKAWIDMELDHSRWYVVSSPLKEVFAGDFYLPSDGAREHRELYTDITFDNELNHRFKPAVFQRGWDKSTANVFEIDADKNELSSPRNVAVKTFWSHVYNDVTEQYGGGVGFSIKTDISDMTSNKPGDDEKVLFRLPKADAEYLYWNKDGSKSGHKTEIDRSENQYRLNDSNGTLVVSSADKCEHFLVGNPFMTHLDIEKFLERNSGLLKQKYWIITEKGQIAGSVTDGGSLIAAASDPSEDIYAAEPSVVPPMQAFFVQANEAVTSLSLVYDETMMRRYDSNGKYLTQTTRAEESVPALKVSSYNYGRPSSAALLVVGEKNASADVEAVDNRDMDVLSTVYTAKDGKALSINFNDDAEGAEIGLITDDETQTILIFEGVDAAGGLYLLDKSDRSLTPLEEGMAVKVDGAAAGRFFLTYGIQGEGVMSGIEWRVIGGELTVVDNSASGSLEVKVYDTLGRLVKGASSSENVLSMDLTPGIYVVDMATPECRETCKIRIVD